jgi:hypothetical protein
MPDSRPARAANDALAQALTDADLAGVRGDEVLVKLPSAEGGWVASSVGGDPRVGREPRGEAVKPSPRL